MDKELLLLIVGDSETVAEVHVPCGGGGTRIRRRRPVLAQNGAATGQYRASLRVSGQERTVPKIFQHVVWPVAGKCPQKGDGPPPRAVATSAMQASSNFSIGTTSPWVGHTPGPAARSASANATVFLQ